MAAIYSVFTSPHHAPMPNHLPTLIVTPHGQPHQILYSYLHTDYNTVNYLLTPSPQGDLCVAKLFPPTRPSRPSTLSEPGHSTTSSSSTSSSRPIVKCEASRDLKWTIENTGIRSPIYKIVNSDDTPLYQISKPNGNADFWTMFYFAYAGHQIPPRRIEFGKISKNPPEKGGGTRITITGKTEDEKKVWQTLGEGNEDCVEWVVACACLNLLDDEILKAAERKGLSPPNQSSSSSSSTPGPGIASSSPSSSSRAIPSPASSHSQPQTQPNRTGSAPQPIRSQSNFSQSSGRSGFSGSSSSGHGSGPGPGARPPGGSGPITVQGQSGSRSQSVDQHSQSSSSRDPRYNPNSSQQQQPHGGSSLGPSRHPQPQGGPVMPDPRYGNSPQPQHRQPQPPQQQQSYSQSPMRNGPPANQQQQQQQYSSQGQGQGNGMPPGRLHKPHGPPPPQSSGGRRF